MRGADIQQDTLFSTVIPEERVPVDHPLRPIREDVDSLIHFQPLLVQQLCTFGVNLNNTYLIQIPG